MASVYDDDNFSGRVNLAANYMIKGYSTTRHFDTCFEMYDGDVVACALYRRALKNPKLADAIPKYLNQSMREETLARYSNISTRGLTEEARKIREEMRNKFGKEYIE